MISGFNGHVEGGQMDTTSILNTIKQMLGVGSDDTNFDRELVVFINGAKYLSSRRF